MVVYCDGYAFYILEDQTVIAIDEEIEEAPKEEQPKDEEKEYEYITTGLKIYLDAENNTGSSYDEATTVWKDLSENGNDGEIKGGTWTEKGLKLDGIDDWMTLGKQEYGNITLEVVFETDETNTSSECIIGNWHNGGYGIGIASGNIKGDAYINGSYDTRKIGTKVSDNTKYKVTITSDGKECKMYVNGELMSTSTPNGLIEMPDRNTEMVIRWRSIEKPYRWLLFFRNIICSKNV